MASCQQAHATSGPASGSTTPPVSKAVPVQKTVDLIVYGDHVVTMDDKKTVLEKGAVAIKDGAIVEVGTAAAIEQRYTASERVPGDNRVVMPGLVNGHTHAAMVLFRGMADDLDLMTWLKKYIFPMEGRYVDRDLVEAGTALACWEMIRSGTTTFVDMYFYPDVIAQVVIRCGLRAVVSAPMIDFPSPGFKGWEDSYAAGVSFAKRWKGKHPRITPALAPHAPYTVSKAHLAQAFEAARNLGVPISIHVAEDQAEVATIKKTYGTTSVDLLAQVGMLEQTTIAAHMVWPSDEDIARLAGSSVGAIHNPTSNMKTGAGFSPVPKLLDANVVVGLGTDGAASNNDLDLWEEVRLAALLHKGLNHDAKLVNAETALDMGTRSGARAVGLSAVTGRLEKGLRADLIQVSLSSPHMAPMYDVVSHLVYAARSHDVVTSIVDGQVIMRERKVLTLDAKQVVRDVERIATSIRADLAAEP